MCVQVLPLMTPAVSAAVCELTLKLYGLNQRFLSRGATAALAAVLSAPNSRCLSSSDRLHDIEPGVSDKKI